MYRRIVKATLYLPPNGDPEVWIKGENCLAIHQVMSEAKIVIERENATDIIYMGIQAVLESE